MAGGSDSGEQLSTTGILTVLRRTLRGMENDPSPYLGMDEENLRSVIVGHLNAAFGGRATAESKNGRGKTDILVPDGIGNQLIAECKVYGGPRSVDDAVSQLLEYTGWRDIEKTIILFVRSPAISVAVAAVLQLAERDNVVSRVEKLDANGGEVLLHGHHEDDPGRPFTVRCLLLHLKIPRPSKGQMLMDERARRPEDVAELMQRVQRSLPATTGVEYTPIFGDSPPERADPQGWAVTYLQTAKDGATGGIQATPTSDEGRRDHAPAGALLPTNAAAARKVHEAVRRAHRDGVRVRIRGVGFRVDRIAPGLRGPMDAMERADPNHTAITYGPRGLWQCTISFESNLPSIEFPIAFAVLDEPKDGWDVTVRGTVFDASLTMSMRRDSRDVDLEWRLGPQEGWASERLAAIRFALALTQPGIMKIRSHEPGLGNGEFDQPGPVDEDLVGMHQLWTALTVISEHVGEDLPLPDEASPEWRQQVLQAARAIETRRVPLRFSSPTSTHGLAIGEEPLPVGTVTELETDMLIELPIGDQKLVVGDAHVSAQFRIARVDTLEPGVVRYVYEQAESGPIEGVLGEAGGEDPEPSQEDDGSLGAAPSG